MVLITGTSSGIGFCTAQKFLDEGYSVFGIDMLPSAIEHPKYTHHQAYLNGEGKLPDVPGVEILVNNAGRQEDCINANLRSAIQVTEKYGLREGIRAIVNVCSTSAHNGAEFPEYAASKGGILAYTKHVAMEVAKYGATCNSISPGGVNTSINQHIMDSEELYKAVLDETLLGKWADPEEIAEWIYFVAVCNRSMTGQDIIIDNGEIAKYNFIW